MQYGLTPRTTRTQLAPVGCLASSSIPLAGIVFFHRFEQAGPFNFDC